MRHSLHFVDLENPEVCFPTVRLEERIMIGAEMPRCVLTMDGGVEHAADVGAIDGTTMHADSDEATGERVHDHEHPVAPEHDGLASKKIFFGASSGEQPSERKCWQPTRKGALI